MIVIYTQDETYIRKNADDARSVLLSVYGEKLGNEAYSAMKNAREGASYRKSGGPLVCAVSKDKAEEIREKEIAIGMM